MGQHRWETTPPTILTAVLPDPDLEPDPDVDMSSAQLPAAAPREWIRRRWSFAYGAAMLAALLPLVTV